MTLTRTSLALCLLLAGTSTLHAQATVSDPGIKGDLAVTFISQYSLKADTTQTFWMEGGSAELGIGLARGIGIAASYTETHTGSIGSTNVPLTLAVTAFGPRYRWHQNKRLSIYGEGLVGVATGSNSIFPTASGTVSNASSFAQEINLGVDYKIHKMLAIRAIDVGYLRTTLPNGTNNEQNTLRIGAGLALTFGR